MEDEEYEQYYPDDRPMSIGSHREWCNLPKTQVVEGVTTGLMPITSAEDKAQRRLEVKDRTVRKEIGGNAATKKTKKNLLKQQYENFTAPSSEMLDQTFDRFQKLVSQLELLDEKLSQEDVNQKLLRSLSLEWKNMLLCGMGIKLELETRGLIDLYNNLKSNEAVTAAHGVICSSTQVNAAKLYNIENLRDAVICSFLASQPNSPQLAHEDFANKFHPDDIE
ncbi:hypothetical protein Tco_1003974 [Tanacetum coccineum]|uniref:Uncharacterized protein n=1 Tax=Tanacetum coccineum TaxID=301880 RepID=A0ABQ5FAJ3_9ASTR